LWIPTWVRAVKRHIWLTRGSDPSCAGCQLVTDFATALHFHREAKGVAMGGRAQTIEDLAPTVANRASALIEMVITPQLVGVPRRDPR